MPMLDSPLDLSSSQLIYHFLCVPYSRISHGFEAQQRSPVLSQFKGAAGIRMALEVTKMYETI